MCAPQLLLSWKDHFGNLVSVFDDLLERNSLVDCTLAAEGQYLKAHKVVLSASSSYFELLFNQESEKNPIVILKDVKYRELEALVSFMYRGVVEISEDRLGALLELADTLQVKGLGSKKTSLASNEREIPRREFPSSSPSREGKSLCTETAKRKLETSSTPPNNAGDTPDAPNSDSSNSNDSCFQRDEEEKMDSSPAVNVSNSYNLLTDREKSCSNQDNPENHLSACEVLVEEGDPADISVLKMEPAVEIYQDDGREESQSYFGNNSHNNWNESHLKRVNDSLRQGNIDSSWLRREAQSSSSVAVKEERLDSSSTWAHVEIENLKCGPSSRVDGHMGGVVGNNPQVTHLAEDKYVTRSGNYQCVYCPYMCTKSCYMKVHTRTHTGEKPYKCTYCPFCARTKSQLNDHLRTHTGERPYKCPTCPYTSVMKSHLTRHIRTHTGERPYKCGFCNYASTTKDNLTTHVRIHTGDRPYKCPYCSYAAAGRSGLKYHIRCVHADLDT